VADKKDPQIVVRKEKKIENKKKIREKKNKK
jgi:hypothetical protein